MKLAPDSSFFIFFLDDLEGLLDEIVRMTFLIRITGNFDIVVGITVNQEVNFKPRSRRIEELLTPTNTPQLKTHQALLEPFRMMLGKGEFEVLVFAFAFYENADQFIFIFDDDKPRSLVREFLPEIKNNMLGTVGFIKHCNCVLKLLDREEAILLLEKMKISKFRIDPCVVNQITKQLR